MMCRHCQTKNSNRPRGLCWRCYNTRSVRDRYPSTSQFARRGVTDFNGRTPRPTEATEAMPGSEEKILILIERAQLGQSLWHPEDRMPLTDGPRVTRDNETKNGDETCQPRE